MADSNERKDSSRRPGTLTRGRSNFLTRTATDEAGELLRRSSLPPAFGSQADGATAAQNIDLEAQTIRRSASDTIQNGDGVAISSPGKVDGPQTTSRRKSSDIDMKNGSKRRTTRSVTSNLRPVGGTDKLSTFSGVFVPTTLNVLSILMFIRFGFILGQTGLLGMLGLLVAAYVINLFTTLSISAVASNGTVRGGGAYYLISRSLGPEFGGSIGIISYLGFVFNTGMNAVGLIDCLTYNFGSESGIWAGWLLETGWWPYLWSTIAVFVCVTICLAGSAIFARASNALLLILLIATFSIPFSALVRAPFHFSGGSRQYTKFTGLSTDTLRQNLLPEFTRGAAGSQIKGKETWSDMFGILFPATGGIFAGASMSGDLKKPSRSIPKGTLYGVLLTFVSYVLVVSAMAASITRLTLRRNVNVVQDINLSGMLILLGEVAATSFSVLMGIVGPAKQLQAIARDGVFPGISIFGQGTKKTDDPVFAILLTWAVAQLTILFDINQIASLVTMSYLMMNFALHSACLLLKISSAPNFRPSFRFFNQWTALLGAALSMATMFFVDVAAATGSIAVLIAIFIIIHFTTPPKPWGADVTAGLVYHQIRKYLLRLKTESVKYWRPQILLFVNDPRRGYKLIKFANSLKKGGLFILGHVIVTDNFGASVEEARKQQSAWSKLIEQARIKSFINVAISPSIEWGARNVFLSAGLGGMRPNIVMMGFYNLKQFREEQPLVDIHEAPLERKSTNVRKRKRSIGPPKEELPTDVCYVEKRTDMQSYVLVLEDLMLKLQTNVAIAANFSDLELPGTDQLVKKYIDLWPIQMSAIIASDNDEMTRRFTTTNFDTYTMILQLGCILNTVPAWKKAYKLRVLVFTEYESDVEEEKSRVTQLLEDLRISAEVLVFWLASGDVKSYQHVIYGEEVDAEVEQQVTHVLEDETWWQDLQQVRGKIKSGAVSAVDAMSLADDLSWPAGSFPNRRDASLAGYDGLRKILRFPRNRSSFSNLSSLGVVPSMRTHRLDDDLLSRHASRASSDSEYDQGSTDFDSESPDDDDDMEDTSGYDDEQNSYFDDLEGYEQRISKSSKSKSTSSGKNSRKSSGKSSKKSSRKSSHSSNRRALGLTDSTAVEEEDNGLIHFDSREAEHDEERGRRHSRDDSQNLDKDDMSPMNDSQLLQRPAQPTSRAQSPIFTADTMPPIRATETEGPGPSIMFADQTHPRHRASPAHARADSEIRTRSIYTRRNEETSPSGASAFSTGSVGPPLSFNDLPCRAQHLILNELISQNTEDTAVIFTTLPAPQEASWKSETDSLNYLTDLEVFTQGLGPVLLVHSNSMTVTTNL